MENKKKRHEIVFLRPLPTSSSGKDQAKEEISRHYFNITFMHAVIVSLPRYCITDGTALARHHVV